MTEQRLIDANILSTSFGTLDWHCYNDCQHCNMKYGTCEAKLTMDDVLHNINSAPTIDAVPVVHGHWESINADDSGYAAIYRCSVCKRGISIGYYDAYCDYEYCPRCGAKMDEECEQDAHK